jgi:Protein of unknown function (DUF3732)
MACRSWTHRHRLWVTGDNAVSFQILEIALYNRRGDRRFIRFRPGTVNIVTGVSKTGKSALIDIVDYCLGRSEYVVAHGVIRDTVIWYALLLQSGNSRILIARPIPPEGQKTGTEVFFTPTADDRTPDFTDLRANSTVKALTQFLTEAAGITPNEHVPPDGQTRNPIRASVDHTKFYLYQQQNRVSDKSLLFYRQEESWAPQTIKDTMPYFLGAAGDEQLDKHLRLQRARRDLKLLERRAKEEEAIRGRDNSNVLALYAEAREAGILPGASQPADFETAVAELRRCLEWRSSAALSEPEGNLGRLTQQRDSLQEQLRQIKREIEAAEAFGQNQAGFTKEAQEQVHRLRAIGLFGDPKAHDETCPLCNQALAISVPTADQIKSSLNHLEKQMETVNRQRPRLDEYINQKEASATELRRRIGETRAEIEAVVAQQEAVLLMRTEEAARARVVGRVSLFLESVLKFDEKSDLTNELNRAHYRVLELEKELSSEDTSERLEAAFRIIGDQITRWARGLELEHSQNPLEFDLRRLTILSFRETGVIPLSEMGSGENWVGYHLTTLLALHKWFVQKKRPVPHFLMIDQPAQYYFPADVRKESDLTSLGDEDREAVRRMFRFVFKVVESLGGQFQVIITEHADLQDDWFQSAVIQRWRGDDKLIPKDWYSPASMDKSQQESTNPIEDTHDPSA